MLNIPKIPTFPSLPSTGACKHVSTERFDGASLFTGEPSGSISPFSFGLVFFRHLRLLKIFVWPSRYQLIITRSFLNFLPIIGTFFKSSQLKLTTLWYICIEYLYEDPLRNQLSFFDWISSRTWIHMCTTRIYYFSPKVTLTSPTCRIDFLAKLSGIFHVPVTYE